MTDLFPVEASLSPRLRWFSRHGTRTNKDQLPRGYIGPRDKPWVCSNLSQTVCAFGDTEHDAILAYCALTGIKHWNVESLEGEPAQHAVPLNFD
jgi:hypothetical protein